MTKSVIWFKFGTEFMKIAYCQTAQYAILLVGVTRLERATSCTPSKHSSQTELHPETHFEL